MQVTETLSDGLKRSYAVVLAAADIENRRTTRLTDLSKTLRLPGFRPGKVPMTVIRQRYGSAVAAEVLEESVSEATRKVLTDGGLRPALQPKVDLVTAEPTTGVKDIEFTVELEILPDIAMPDFSAISLTRLKAETAAETIDKVVSEIAARNRELTDLTEEELAARPEGAGAVDGDVLTVDFLGKLDGVEFPGGQATDADVDIGGSGFIPGFAEQLVGMKPAESKTISVTFPEDYGSPDLAGKNATFDVVAKKIRKASVPALDDAFAQKLAFETLEELREAISKRSQSEYDAMSRMRLKRQLLDSLADLASFPTPPSMVDMEFDQIWQRLEADRKEGRLDEDDKSKDDDTLRTEYRAIAERRVRLGLLLAEIGRVNSLVVTEDEMNRAMRAELSRYPGQEAAMMEIFRKYPAMADNLRGPIFEDKVVDYVLSLTHITDEVVSPEDLAKDPPVPTAAA